MVGAITLGACAAGSAPAGELASYDFPGANDEVVALLAREAADPAASPRDE